MCVGSAISLDFKVQRYSATQHTVIKKTVIPLSVMLSKLFVLGLCLVATVYAKNGTAPEGEQECTFNYPDTEIKQKCPWYTTCHESKNKTLSGCLVKGQVNCPLYQYLGTSGDIVSNNLPSGCHPTESCCSGKCCSETQACVQQQGPSDAMFEYDYRNLNVEAVARNGWQTPAGEDLKNRPMICVDRVFAADTGSKAVFTPMVATVLLVIIAISGCKRSETGLIDKIAPAFIIFTGFFLMMSEGWAFSLLTNLVASATMACPKEHHGKLIIGQLLFLWLFFGGSQIFFDNHTQNGLVNFFDLAQTHDLSGETGLEASCAKFYHYYTYAEGERVWSTSSTRMSYGLCAREFLGYLIVLAYVNAFAVFVMITHSFHSYLSPLGVRDDGHVEVQNPVSSTGNQNKATTGSDNNA